MNQKGGIKSNMCEGREPPFNVGLTERLR